MRRVIVDIAIAAGYYGMFAVLPFPTTRQAAASADPGTFAGVVFFAYAASVLFASLRWDDSSYILRFFANQPSTAWLGTGFGLISLYLLMTWAL